MSSRGSRARHVLGALGHLTLSVRGSLTGHRLVGDGCCFDLDLYVGLEEEIDADQ